jgi:hypothetical protein
MKTEFLLFKNIFFLSALKYSTNFNYTNYNLKSISGKANRHNQNNSVTDSDGLKSDQSRGGYPNLF